jgi:hypothetical protein
MIDPLAELSSNQFRFQYSKSFQHKPNEGAGRNAFKGGERPALRQLVAAANATLLGQRRQILQLKVANVEA